MKTQSGFTLIEMVAVIIILAIMAATALPKFTNLTSEARYASLSGLSGGLRSAAVLARAKWTAAQSANLDSVNFNGTYVSVIAAATPGSSVNNMGYPQGQTAAGGTGIELAMDSLSTYTSGLDNGDVAWWPNGVTTSSLCYVKYQSSTGVVTTTPATADLAMTNCV
ncbi:MAG: type II secretion system protein [Sulfuricella sp.]|nr:type II secretion system protein [Sulfuricella sp.]